MCCCPAVIKSIISTPFQHHAPHITPLCAFRQKHIKLGWRIHIRTLKLRRSRKDTHHQATASHRGRTKGMLRANVAIAIEYEMCVLNVCMKCARTLIAAIRHQSLLAYHKIHMLGTGWRRPIYVHIFCGVKRHQGDDKLDREWCNVFL